MGVKKLIAVFGTVTVLLSLGSIHTSPAGAGDVLRAAGSGVTVSGTPAVGSTLTATPGMWTQEPDQRTYEWLRDGEGDVLSRAPDYVPSAADMGHTLVVVERIRLGAIQDESSSTPVSIMAAAAPTAVPAPTVVPAPTAAPVQPLAIVPAVNQRRPTITGTAKVGRKLAVRSKGTWVAPGHRFTYQWLRNGRTIRGATGPAYKLSKKDRKKTISVRVSAQRPGYPTVSVTSPRSKRVR